MIVTVQERGWVTEELILMWCGKGVSGGNSSASNRNNNNNSNSNNDSNGRNNNSHLERSHTFKAKMMFVRQRLNHQHSQMLKS